MKVTSKAIVIAVLLVPALLPAQSAHEVYDGAARMEAEADKELNTAYEHLIKNLRAEHPDADSTVERLRESQRAWLKYRETQVAFVGAYGDISSSSARAAGMADYSVELTKQRIKDLRDVPNPF